MTESEMTNLSLASPRNEVKQRISIIQRSQVLSRRKICKTCAPYAVICGYAAVRVVLQTKIGHGGNTELLWYGKVRTMA